MILVDFSNISYRCLFSAIKDIPNASKSSEYGGLMLHQMLEYFNTIQKDFSATYGNEIILCLDSPVTWRGQLYPEYKKSRKKDSKIDWEDFFSFRDEFLQDMLCLPYKQAFTPLAEADDIIYVLSKHAKEKVLIISEDKDFLQLKSDKIDIYRPIAKCFLEVPPKGIGWALAYHICLGDKVDNIPSIKEYTIPTPEYSAFLQDENNKDKEFEGVKWKPGRFGEKSAAEFTDNLLSNLRGNPAMYQRFLQNRALIDMRKLPKLMEERILETPLQGSYDADKMDLFYQKYNLRKISATMHLAKSYDFVGWNI